MSYILSQGLRQSQRKNVTISWSFSYCNLITKPTMDHICFKWAFKVFRCSLTTIWPFSHGTKILKILLYWCCLNESSQDSLVIATIHDACADLPIFPICCTPLTDTWTQSVSPGPFLAHLVVFIWLNAEGQISYSAMCAEKKKKGWVESQILSMARGNGGLSAL